MSTDLDEAPDAATPEHSSRPSGALPDTDLLPPPALGHGSPPVADAEVERLRARLSSRLLGVEPASPRIGRFVLLDRIGEGGMGVVYSAYDDRLDRRVAIKLLHPDADRDAVDPRLLREAQAMARLSHPNVVAVYEVGEHDGRVFVAMELVRGCPLRQWRKQARPAWREIVAMYVQAGRGLAAAHAAGLIHRDFKPDNVLLGEDGRVRVVDFGLVLAPDRELDAERRHDAGPAAEVRHDDRLTRTGALVGTPAYMAPEQFMGGRVDARTDQFAFCVSLWEALWGERPFADESRSQLVAAVTGGRLRDPPRADVPRWIHAVLARGLAVAPDARWGAMNELLEQLGRDRARRRRMLAASGGGLALVAAALWAGGRFATADPCATVADPFAGAWDDAQRGAVAAAFSATSSPVAADAASRVDSLLTAEVDAMGTVAEASCRAHASGVLSAAAFDRRMSCLGLRSAAVATLVERLRNADAPVVERAVDGVLALTPVERCSDDDSLADDLAAPEEIAAEVAELRGRLAEADTRTTLGLHDDALALATAALERAQQLDHAPLVAEALLTTGAAAAAAENESTQSDLELALFTAQSSGHDVVVLGASRRLVDLADHGFRIDPMPWARLAEATGARIGDPISRADGLSTLGQAQVRGHAWAAARATLERVVALREDAQGLEAPQLTKDLPHLARAAGSLRDVAAVETHLDRALAIAEHTWGPAHPQIVVLSLTAADVAAWSGLDDLALRHYERAIAVLDALDRNESIESMWVLVGSAVVLQRVGRPAEAAPRFRAAITIGERELGAEHMQVVAAVRSLAFTTLALGEHAEAERLARRAVAGMSAQLGGDHAWAAIPRVALGEALIGLGRHAEAVETLEQALRTLAKDDAANRARANVALARARAHAP